MHAQPSDPLFLRPRAELLRELLAQGLDPKQIRAWFVERDLPAPSPEAIYRAKSYKVKNTPASRPSYYFLWAEFLRAWDRAHRAGKLLAVTRELKAIIDAAEGCVLQDQTHEPSTPRRKRKRK